MGNLRNEQSCNGPSLAVTQIALRPRGWLVWRIDMTETAAYLTVLASHLGDPVDIDHLDDPEIVKNAALLRREGIRSARVSPLSTLELALMVTPGGAPGTSRPCSFEAIVVCTDSIGDMVPTGWLIAYKSAAGLSSVPAYFVSGSACANFVAALDVARGLLAIGGAERVLLVTADRAQPKERYPPAGSTVYSDGAVSCLVSTEPEADASFRVLRTATESWKPDRDRLGDLTTAKTVAYAMASVTRQLTEDDEPNYEYLLTPNFGITTRQLIELAASLPRAVHHPGTLDEVGHCFSADMALNLQHLEKTGRLVDGDQLLAVATGQHALSGVALRCELR